MKRNSRRHLPLESITELWDAAVACNLFDEGMQRSLLSGFEPALVSSLPVNPRLDARLYETLHRLNELPPQRDGALPMKTWLRNAVSLTQTDTRAAVFERALASLREARVDDAVEGGAATPELPAEPPVYPDERRRVLGERLQALEAARRKLKEQGEDTSAEVTQIRELKRLLRRGPEPEAGDFLANGRFQLLAQLGKGGFGVVWKALDTESGILVAIKLLHGHFANDASRRERFFRGSERMASLDHPHVVRVLLKRGIEPYGEHWTLYYFVMEFLRGGDFKRAVLQGSLSVDDRVRAIRETALALEYAHARSLIHRDVSPDNILLDEQGHARLTDFDLVRADDSVGPTATKMGMGKFLFAAPEAMEDASKVDARADVYGLGMTLAFALYGRELTVECLIERDAFLSGLQCSESVRFAVRKAVHTQVDSRYADVRRLREALEQAPAVRPSGMVKRLLSRASRRVPRFQNSVLYRLAIFILVLAIVGRVILVPEEAAQLRSWLMLETTSQKQAADRSFLTPAQIANGATRRPEVRKLKLWPNGSRLKVRFMDGDPQLHERIQKIASEWTRYANLTFEFTSKSDPDADIRVSVAPGEGWWSYQGTDARLFAFNSVTMHLGFATQTLPQREFSTRVLKEFGKALGLEDEWKNPNATAHWDREAAYAYFAKIQNWTREETDRQILGPHPPTDPPYRAFDPESVMFMSVPRELLVGNVDTYERGELSESDKAFIARLYPKKP